MRSLARVIALQGGQPVIRTRDLRHMREIPVNVGTRHQRDPMVELRVWKSHTGFRLDDAASSSDLDSLAAPEHTHAERPVRRQSVSRPLHVPTSADLDGGFTRTQYAALVASREDLLLDTHNRVISELDWHVCTCMARSAGLHTYGPHTSTCSA